MWSVWDPHSWHTHPSSIRDITGIEVFQKDQGLKPLIGYTCSLDKHREDKLP